MMMMMMMMMICVRKKYSVIMLEILGAIVQNLFPRATRSLGVMLPSPLPVTWKSGFASVDNV